MSITLRPFQQNCVDKLIEYTVSAQNESPIILKAPTGSGKTFILDSFIKTYFDNISLNTIFVWLCPGDGNLQNQSYEKFKQYYPNYKCGLLNDILTTGFESETVYFINWQKIIGKDRLALQEGEKLNLFEHIINAHNSKYEFILIIDEEHRNDTEKARSLISAFKAKAHIRASATIKYELSNALVCEINELDVIDSGLLTKAIYINESCEDYKVVDYVTEAEYLIEIANDKLNNIKDAYEKLNLDITPLMLIQVPNKSDTLIETVEQVLFDLGYSYEDATIGKWLANEKINIDFISNNNCKVKFLIFKQGIATGWDCPRAKILVKLRDNMSETFEIQTIGRIRRMPEAKHYNDDILNYSYLYTFDTKYVQDVIQETQYAYNVKRLNLKDKCKTFQLVGDIIDSSVRVNENDLFITISNYFYKKFSLTGLKNNKETLEKNSFIFATEINKTAYQGKVIKTDALTKQGMLNTLTFKNKIGVVRSKYDFLNARQFLARHMQLPYDRANQVLQHLFLKKSTKNAPAKKILSLEKKEYYAFIINNQKHLGEIFDEIRTLNVKQKQIIPEPKPFKIPLEEIYKFNKKSTNIITLETNSYKGYTSDIIEHPIRSSSEIYFEKFCEESIDIVDWYYKNGDKGDKYFSIAYQDGLGVMKLFYPDYIVKLKTGEVWIIETKGGEANNINKNIDRDVKNKFLALREYSFRNNLKFAFVRDSVKTGHAVRLVYSNTTYEDKLKEPCWKDIDLIFK